jgi:hypothetical protein
MLDKEFQWYLENQDTLVQKYEGKYIVIINQTVVGSYSSKAKAYFESQKIHPLGTFLIQLCEKGTDAYTQTFNSRVTFA